MTIASNCLNCTFSFQLKYFNQAMPSAIGGSVPVGVGNNAGITVSNTVGSGTTHSTSTTIVGNTVNAKHVVNLHTIFQKKKYYRIMEKKSKM